MASAAVFGWRVEADHNLTMSYTVSSNSRTLGIPTGSESSITSTPSLILDDDEDDSRWHEAMTTQSPSWVSLKS